jgi:hypothetical protein
MALPMATAFAAMTVPRATVDSIDAVAFSKAEPRVVAARIAAARCSDSTAAVILAPVDIQCPEAARILLSSPTNIAVNALSWLAASAAATGGM